MDRSEIIKCQELYYILLTLGSEKKVSSYVRTLMNMDFCDRFCNLKEDRKKYIEFLGQKELDKLMNYKEDEVKVINAFMYFSGITRKKLYLHLSLYDTARYFLFGKFT